MLDAFFVTREGKAWLVDARAQLRESRGPLGCCMSAIGFIGNTVRLVGAPWASCVFS